MKLTTGQRGNLPTKDFAGPNRSFPVENPTHAREAISGATQSVNVGNITPQQAAAIKAKARQVLGKGK